MNEEPTTRQWVCQHCMFHLVNGDCTEPDTCTPGSGDGNDPMHLFGSMHVTPGMLSEYHECGRQDGEDVDECDCEEQWFFSWSSCDGCGSLMGGERYAVTGWIPIKETVA